MVCTLKSPTLPADHSERALREPSRTSSRIKPGGNISFIYSPHLAQRPETVCAKKKIRLLEREGEGDMEQIVGCTPG